MEDETLSFTRLRYEHPEILQIHPTRLVDYEISPLQGSFILLSLIDIEMVWDGSTPESDPWFSTSGECIYMFDLHFWHRRIIEKILRLPIPIHRKNKEKTIYKISILGWYKKVLFILDGYYSFAKFSHLKIWEIFLFTINVISEDPSVYLLVFRDHLHHLVSRSATTLYRYTRIITLPWPGVEVLYYR